MSIQRWKERPLKSFLDDFEPKNISYLHNMWSCGFPFSYSLEGNYNMQIVGIKKNFLPVTCLILHKICVDEFLLFLLPKYKRKYRKTTYSLSSCNVKTVSICIYRHWIITCSIYKSTHLLSINMTEKPICCAKSKRNKS